MWVVVLIVFSKEEMIKALLGIGAMHSLPKKEY